MEPETAERPGGSPRRSPGRRNRDNLLPMDAPRSPAPFRLGRWLVTPRAGTLVDGDEEFVRVDDRALRVLARLAATPGEVVSVEALLEAAWPDVVVSPDSVYQAVATLRRALGDTTKEPTYIATVPRQGYRLVAAVEPVDDAAARGAAPAEPAVPVSSAAPVADAPSVVAASSPPPRRLAAMLAAVLGIAALAGALAWGVRSRTGDGDDGLPPRAIAVLPFADLTDKMDKEPFADGVTEQLIETLSRLPGAQVASRTDSFALKGSTQPSAALGRTLHARWLVEGSVRQAGERLRITARLVRAADGASVWSQDYDRTEADALRVQDEIAAEVGKALEKSWPH